MYTEINFTLIEDSVRQYLDVGNGFRVYQYLKEPRFFSPNETLRVTNQSDDYIMYRVRLVLTPINKRIIKKPTVARGRFRDQLGKIVVINSPPVSCDPRIPLEKLSIEQEL